MDEKDFALRLARLREQKGVSARDMSLSLVQNPGYINNIELGKLKPSLSGILFICDYFGLTPSKFFDMGTTSPIRLKGLIEDLNMLNNRQLDTVSALVKEMIKR